jgi:hypothetical protein
MDLIEARQILGSMSGTIPSAQWRQELITAIQVALAELYVLSPYDDVDGQVGPRTRDAWKFFKEALDQADPDTIERGSADALMRALDDPVGFIGPLKVNLQPDFEFRRRQSQANRQQSAQAIIAASKVQHLTKAQIAYILATAEHESDSFNTLEEYASGNQYEGRKDLGNTEPGDGVRFKGRGYVQLTGRRNYTKYTETTGVELVKLPIILMNWPALSVFVLVDGMMRGAYTNRRLDEFVNESQEDFFNARQVVNGHDRAQKIADQANDWLKQPD